MSSSSDTDPPSSRASSRHSNRSVRRSRLSPGAIAVQQALHVASIKTHVPIVLTQSPPNYASWRNLFFVTLGKFNLQHHVDGSNPSDDEEWSILDYTVLSWLYSSVSDDILSLIMKPGATALQIWLTIENLFRDNKKARAIQLESEFRGLKQGSLTVGEYCKQLKTLADGLADVDNAVSDENLVLQTLSGLGETYAHMAAIIQFQSPFPTFQQTRSCLILEETRRKHC